MDVEAVKEEEEEEEEEELYPWDYESVHSNLCGALKRRLVSYSVTSEHFWLFSGSPYMTIGSLVRADSICVLTSSSLKKKDKQIPVEALSVYRKGYQRGCRSLRDMREVYFNNLAFECIFRGDSARLEALPDDLLKETVGESWQGGTVNAFHYAAALGDVDCLSILIRRLGDSFPLLSGKDSHEILSCCDARLPFGDREGVVGVLSRLPFFKDEKLLISLLESASESGAAWLVSFVFSHMGEAGISKGALNRILESACEEGNADCARLLLERGAKWGWARDRLLTTAADRGHADVSRLLLERGADPNAVRSHDGVPALVLAAEGGFKETARVLLEFGASRHCGMSYVMMEDGSMAPFGLQDEFPWLRELP